MELSGGLQGGSEPPAFQRAEKQRMAMGSSEDQPKEVAAKDMACDNEIGHTQVNAYSLHNLIVLFSLYDFTVFIL